MELEEAKLLRPPASCVERDLVGSPTHNPELYEPVCMTFEWPPDEEYDERFAEWIGEQNRAGRTSFVLTTNAMGGQPMICAWRRFHPRISDP
jgi:hypothetical protein